MLRRVVRAAVTANVSGWTQTCAIGAGESRPLRAWRLGRVPCWVRTSMTGCRCPRPAASARSDVETGGTPPDITCSATLSRHLHSVPGIRPARRARHRSGWERNRRDDHLGSRGGTVTRNRGPLARLWSRYLALRAAGDDPRVMWWTYIGPVWWVAPARRRHSRPSAHSQIPPLFAAATPGGRGGSSAAVIPAARPCRATDARLPRQEQRIHPIGYPGDPTEMNFSDSTIGRRAAAG